MSDNLARESIETRFIAAIVKDVDGGRLEDCRSLPTEVFSNARCARAWVTLCNSTNFIEAQSAPECRAFFSHDTVGESYKADREFLFIASLRQFGLDRVDEWRASLPIAGESQLRRLLTTRRFSQASPPPEPEARFLIQGKPVCTPGNLTNIIAQAKAGKSAFVGAMISAVACAEAGNTDADNLGVTASLPRGRVLIHLDTEQSPFDHHQMILRALRRAGVTVAPAWLLSFALAGFSARELRRALEVALADHAKPFAVLLDGVADFVVDVNDPAEANAFVAELHAFAIKSDCPVVNVIHENPGSESGKMRGHLGSQLERKAESNLRLKKVEESTTVFSEKMRRAPILEKDGPRFRWDDGEGMHVSVESVGTARDSQKVAELHDIAVEVFEGGKLLSYSEVRAGVEEARGCSRATAERKVAEMRKALVIRAAGGGKYGVAA